MLKKSELKTASHAVTRCTDVVQLPAWINTDHGDTIAQLFTLPHPDHVPALRCSLAYLLYPTLGLAVSRLQNDDSEANKQQDTPFEECEEFLIEGCTKQNIV
jgi:hypothetical protein